MDSKNIRWTMYVQNPEECDDQGYYLKAEGEEAPWVTETDCEEFDGILDVAKEGFYIHDLASANRALAAHMWRGTVTKIVWW